MAFVEQEPTLNFEAPCIACKGALAADNPVAGNDNADGIAAHSLSHGLSGHVALPPGGGNFPGDAAVGAQLPLRNAAENFPDLLLEGGPGGVQREPAMEGASPAKYRSSQSSVCKKTGSSGVKSPAGALPPMFRPVRETPSDKRTRVPRGEGNKE